MSAGLYNDLNSFLKKKFGEKVFKVSIDAGFSCPNLDGRKSDEGCIFCNNESIIPAGRKAGEAPLVQLEKGIEYMRKRHRAKKFIAYLQPYSNTYAPLRKLESLYEPVMENVNVVGMAVSTRPDCLDDGILDYLCRLSQKKYLWLELGLQSCFDETLAKINRNHSYGDFLGVFEKCRERRIPVCVHVIFGLPGETREMMLGTVEKLSLLSPFGIKIHALHVLKNTKLHEDYMSKKFALLQLEDYVALVADAIEAMDPGIVIHRLTGEGPRSLTVAPDWIFNKLRVINLIREELSARGTFQGIKFQKRSF